MIKRTALLFKTLFFLLIAQSSLAQVNSEPPGQIADSAITGRLDKSQKELKRLETQRMADSLQKVLLLAQLEGLQDGSRKNQQLRDSINAIEIKEQQGQTHRKRLIDSLRQHTPGFPVRGFFNDTLFAIYVRQGSFSASERAEAVTARIQKLGSNYSFSKDSLLLTDTGTNLDIVYGDLVIVSLSQEDALWAGKPLKEYASAIREKVTHSLEGYKDETSLITILKEIGMALLLLAVLFTIIFFTIRLFRWTAAKIKLQQGKKIQSLKIKDYTLLDDQKLTDAFLLLNRIIKWLFIILLIYISLPVLFAIFPWTSGLADTLLSYFITPLKKIGSAVLNYLPNLFTIIVIFVVFRYVIKFFRYLKSEVEEGKLTINGFYPDWAAPSFQIIRVLLYAFMFTVIFPYLPGSDSPVFKGVSVFLGVLFTFGSSGSLSNIMSGLVLTYMRAYKIGDRVKIGDITGDIIEKSLLVTRIRTIKNEIISVPNSNVMSSHTINYSSDAPEKGLIIHTTVTIGYDVPWKQMQQVLIDAALRTDHVLKEPLPFVLQTSLEDFYVAYQINAYTREPGKQALIYSQLHQNIQDCSNEAGIEIMSPHYRAGRDGSQTTIPESYWKKKG